MSGNSVNKVLGNPSEVPSALVNYFAQKLVAFIQNLNLNQLHKRVLTHSDQHYQNKNQIP